MVNWRKGSPVRGNNQYFEMLLVLTVNPVNWHFGGVLNSVPLAATSPARLPSIQGSVSMNCVCAPIRRILFFKSIKVNNNKMQTSRCSWSLTNPVGSCPVDAVV